MGVGFSGWPAPVSFNIDSANLRIELNKGFSLLVREPGSHLGYPSCQIQKGLLLACGERELSEEGIGFGVPLFKRGWETYFPGSARFSAGKSGSLSAIEINYELDLVERLARNGKSIEMPAIYRSCEYFAGLYRKYRVLRETGLALQNRLLRLSGLEIEFRKAISAGTVRVVYAVSPGQGLVHIDSDFSTLKRAGRGEIIMANEQGAGCFDLYQDSDGFSLQGKAINAWEETSAGEASFTCSQSGISFTLGKARGARLFRGREILKGRISWSGLNYVLPQDILSFSYDIKIGR